MTISYTKAAGANSLQNGSQSPERIYNKNMVVCFTSRVDFEALAEALDKEGYLSDVVGYQKVSFSQRFAIVFKNTQTRDQLVENGINVNGIHVNFAYHCKKEDPKIRVYISQLPIGIGLRQIYEVFKVYDIFHDITKIERIIQGRKIDTGDRVINYFYEDSH